MRGEVLIVDSKTQETVFTSNLVLGIREGMIRELAIHVGSSGIEHKENRTIAKLINRAIADSKVGPNNGVEGRIKRDAKRSRGRLPVDRKHMVDLELRSIRSIEIKLVVSEHRKILTEVDSIVTLVDKGPGFDGHLENRERAHTEASENKMSWKICRDRSTTSWKVECCDVEVVGLIGCWWKKEGGGLDLLYRLLITKGGCLKSVTPRSHVRQALPGSEHSIIVKIS